MYKYIHICKSKEYDAFRRTSVGVQAPGILRRPLPFKIERNSHLIGSYPTCKTPKQTPILQ